MDEDRSGIGADPEYVIDDLPALVAVCLGPDHVFAYANESYQRIVGRRALIGRPFLDALPELGPQGYGELLGEVFRTGEPRSRDEEEVLLARGPGGALEPAYFDFTVAPFPRSGERRGVLIQGVEVTESVLARRLAHDAQAQLAALLADAPIGMGVFDADGRFLMLNEELARINGVPLEDHLGRTLEELLGEFGAEQARTVGRVLSSGSPVHELAVQGQTPAQPGVKRRWTVSYYPVVVDGRTVAVGATCAEVTHLHRLQAELDEARRRESEDRFRRAVDGLHDSVAILSPIRGAGGTVDDFTIEYVNASVREVGGRGADELVGLTMLDAWPALAVEELMEAYRVTLATGEPAAIDGFEYDAEVDGRHVWGVYDLRATRLGDDVFVAWRDVTERVVRDRDLVESRVELARQRMAVEILQHVVQPVGVPERPGYRFDTLYLPATDFARVGGDWFDHVELDDGRVLLSIGDVAGHGLPAAQLMGQLRNGTRAVALMDPDPRAVVRLLDRVVRNDRSDRFATATYLLLDPGTGALEWLSAGHLPFAVQRPTGEWSFSEPCTLPPLGCGGIGPDETALRATLAPGGSLLLFTDGLVERRGEPIDAGLDRLLDALHDAGRALGSTPSADGELCRTVARRCLGDGPLADDVCLLLVRRDGPTEAPRR